MKTLDEPVRRLANDYLDDNVNNLSHDEDEDSDDMGDEQNLLEQVKQNVEKMAYSGNLHEKSNTKKRWWTTEEDDKLKCLVVEHGARNWKKIASYFEDRSDVQCLHRWQKVLNPKLIKGPWVRNLCDVV